MDIDLKITDNPDEMIELGRKIIAEDPKRYPTAMLEQLWEKVTRFFQYEGDFYSFLYGAIYCQALYGTSIVEYLYYDFAHRTHAEKLEYLTWYNRNAYIAFLNCVKDCHLLDNKFEAYTLLKAYYKRDAMLLSDEGDFPSFCDFAAKHKTIFVKPINLGLAEGVHRLDIREDTDLHSTFHSLLAEARNLHSAEINRPIIHQLILEEFIVPSKTIAQFNPAEMSVLRVPTIAVNGKIHVFYPIFRMMCGDGNDAQGELYSIDALIDAETGVVLTGGMSPLMTEREYHPVSGVRIKGFAMPEWKELKAMLTCAALTFPTLRYIGWDVVHTEKGWVIIEGNTHGEFFSQICLGHGIKSELEKLIGFHFNLPPGINWLDIVQKKVGKK